MATAVRRKPFRILEFGIGKKPAALIRRAHRALAEGKSHWDFAGVDTKIDIDAALRRARISKVPENLNLIEECVMHTLARAPPESADVIFGSYVFNNLKEEESCIMQGYSCKAAFLELAKNVLKPRGRLVLVQNKGHLEPLKAIARAEGFDFCAVEITDEAAKKSPSWAIRMRATPKRRLAMINQHYLKKTALAEEEISGLLKRGAIKSREEWAKPFVYLLTKPKGMPKGRIIIIEGPADKLSPQRLQIARAIAQALEGYFGK